MLAQQARYLTATSPEREESPSLFPQSMEVDVEYDYPVSGEHAQDGRMFRIKLTYRF